MNTKLDSRKKRIGSFTKEVWAYYRAHGRHDMAWRRDTSPYSIVVSEIMLQQTQVSRVETKFASWMKRFPSWRALAAASTKDVLSEWSGLGYNRRALYLKRIAEHLQGTSGARSSDLPDAYDTLRELPGIGPNTAGAILAYAFNKPHPFIETNIRSAYIHFFFPKSRAKIPDTKLMPLIEETLADPYIHAHAREWHWALMDYGAYIKSMHPNPSRKSVHHVKQSSFKGSNRELRAAMLRFILEKPARSSAIVKEFPAYPAVQVRKNLAALAGEGFLAEKDGTYRIV
jgi:A/G-specific adenine glycosylase